jgi:hypothetical protein
MTVDEGGPCMRFVVLRSILLLALASCSAQPPRVGPDSDPRAARELLATAAAAGPVRLEVNGIVRASDTTLRQPRIAEQAARGVRNMTVRFTGEPDGAGSARLLLLFDPPAAIDVETVCTAPSLPPSEPSAEPLRLRAIFCDGGTFIADTASATTGTTAADVDRLIWRTVGALFPDDYPQTYGIRSFFGW